MFWFDILEYKGIVYTYEILKPAVEKTYVACSARGLLSHTPSEDIESL